MNAIALLWLIFSSGGIEVAKAPPTCTALLDQGLIQVRPGKIPCYCVGPLGYARIVRL
ncbi:MAG: hypothetical protein QG599_1075 [Pseudomonadota bacterium]|nr:hypothetical protein [Pseudomonadota bacterium]